MIDNYLGSKRHCVYVTSRRIVQPLFKNHCTPSKVMKAITMQGLQQYERNRMNKKKQDLKRQTTAGLARKLEKKRNAEWEHIVINLTLVSSNSNRK